MTSIKVTGGSLTPIHWVSIDQNFNPNGIFIPVSVEIVIQKRQILSSSSAINLTLTANSKYKNVNVFVTFSTTTTTSEDLVIAVNGIYTLVRVNPSVDCITEVAFTDKFALDIGDIINVTFPNTDTISTNVLIIAFN